MKKNQFQEAGENTPPQIIPEVRMTAELEQQFLQQVERQMEKVLMAFEERHYKLKKETEKVFSIDEVADYIGFQKASIYGLINRKSIPYIKCGRLVKFEKSQIDLWLQSKRRKTITEIQADADRYIKRKRFF